LYSLSYNLGTLTYRWSCFSLDRSAYPLRSDRLSQDWGHRLRGVPKETCDLRSPCNLRLPHHAEGPGALTVTPDRPTYFEVQLLGAIPGRGTDSLTTAIVFAINQLSPSSISISPLTTIQPRILQHPQVRSNYRMMARSLGFGSISRNCINGIHSAFALLQANNLLTPYAIGK